MEQKQYRQRRLGEKPAGKQAAACSNGFGGGFPAAVELNIREKPKRYRYGRVKISTGMAPMQGIYFTALAKDNVIMVVLEKAATARKGCFRKADELKTAQRALNLQPQKAVWRTPKLMIAMKGISKSYQVVRKKASGIKRYLLFGGERRFCGRFGPVRLGKSTLMTSRLHG
jgi:hypothetical protein